MSCCERICPDLGAFCSGGVFYGKWCSVVEGCFVVEVYVLWLRSVYPHQMNGRTQHIMGKKSSNKRGLNTLSLWPNCLLKDFF